MALLLNKKHISIVLLERAVFIVQEEIYAQEQFTHNVLSGLTEEEKKKILLLIVEIVWMIAGFNVARLGVLSYLNFGIFLI